MLNKYHIRNNWINTDLQKFHPQKNIKISQNGSLKRNHIIFCNRKMWFFWNFLVSYYFAKFSLQKYE